MADIGGLTVARMAMAEVESFRGRRGWHLVFHYDVRAEGAPDGPNEARWFAADDLPRTVHGAWEKDVVARLTAAG